MSHDEIRRVLEVAFPELRERAHAVATLLRRLVDGEPLARILAEAVRLFAPAAPPASEADATPLPPTLPTGKPTR
ncbi:MAG TPA: hypothetical protein VFS00_23855 [Polyangiaceae bacterium]|nr:hypothetical protein [Polyangiaceae bacterium]